MAKVQMPTRNSVYKVLKTKEHLMTQKMKSTLYELFHLLDKDGIPKQRHIDAWEAFLEAERNEERPKDPLDVLTKRVDELEEALALQNEIIAQLISNQETTIIGDRDAK